MVPLAPHLLLLLLPSLASTSPVRVVADGDSLPAAMVSYARMQISNMTKNSMQTHVWKNTLHNIYSIRLRDSFNQSRRQR